MADIPVGSLVEVSAGKGTVRFSGHTQFSQGKWIGVELSEPKGKNDGTVNGVAYFSCRLNYGVFVRASQVRVLEAPKEPATTTSRPVHKRTPSINATPSLNRSTSMKSGLSTRSASPSKTMVPPAAPPQNRSTGPSPLSPPTSAASKRASQLQLGQSQNLTHLASTSQPPPSSRFPPRPPSSARETIPDSSPKLRPRITPDIPSSHSPAYAEPSSETIPPSPIVPSPTLPSSSPSISTKPIPPPDDSQELRAKLRVLEAKRGDDARHIRELENRLSEAEAFVALRPKLQAKLQSLQTDNVALKRSLSDAKLENETFESRLLETQEQLEMAMLDKEVAEEKAEAAEGDLESEKEKRIEYEVELEVWRSGGAEGGAGKDVKSTMAYIQLEKHNERLKEGIAKVRQLSQDMEAEHRREVADLERELAATDDLQSQFEQTLAKLENAESQVEDLKAQLDDALGAEEMLVQLTERNLLMGEKIEEMRITIEDLESLKELNDELEESHVETEKALQEEIDQKEAVARDLARKVDALQDGLLDYESTIQQFRELVLNLQAELDHLREQNQTHQTISQTQATQSAAVMSLNMKLQSSVLKNQAKNIDLELRKLDAAQSKELLAIVQPYLPEAYSESDRNATSCYMFFQRLSHKADIINSVVAQTYGLPDSLNGEVTESLIGVCEMRGRISHFSSLCKRFSAVLRKCDVESFLGIGKLYPELAPMEKRIDMHIELLRREEFRVIECVGDMQKILSQFDHLAETYFGRSEHDLSERELDLALSVDHDLDTVISAIAFTKTELSNAAKDDDIVIELDDLDIQSQLFEPLDDLLKQLEGAKVAARKISKRVEDLNQESSAIKSPLLSRLAPLTDYVSKCYDFGIQLAQHIRPYLLDVRASKQSFQLTAILSAIRDIAKATMGTRSSSSWASVRELIGALVQEINSLLPFTLEVENVVKIKGEAPWVLRVEEVKSTAAVNLDAERKVVKLHEEMQDLVRSVKTRDQNLQEASVKIELMERRLETIKKQADTIGDLESELNKARKQERAYEEAMEQLQADLDTLEQDNARLKQTVNAPERQASGLQAVESETIAVEGSFETSHLLEQIESLRGAVRFLRTENTYLKGQDLLKEIYSLPLLPELPPIPPLDPSSSSSEESQSDSENDVSPSPPPTLSSLALETKLLYRDVITYSSSPRVVDLSALNDRKAWVSQRKTPAHQLWERKMEGEKLQRRVRGLVERAGNIGLRGRAQ